MQNTISNIQKKPSFSRSENILIHSALERLEQLNSETPLSEYDPVLNISEATVTDKAPHVLETLQCSGFSFSNVIKKIHFTTSYNNVNQAQKLKNITTSTSFKLGESNCPKDAVEDFPTYDAIESAGDSRGMQTTVIDVHRKSELPVYDALKVSETESLDFHSHATEGNDNMPIYDTLQEALVSEETLPNKDTFDSSTENEVPIYDVLQYCEYNGKNEMQSYDHHCEFEHPVYDDVVHTVEDSEASYVQDVQKDAVGMEDHPPSLKTKPQNFLKSRLISTQKAPNNFRNASEPLTSFLYKSAK